MLRRRFDEAFSIDDELAHTKEPRQLAAFHTTLGKRQEKPEDYECSPAPRFEGLRSAARNVRPKFRTSRVKFDLSGKSTYTQAEVDSIVKQLVAMHQAELEEQHNVFQIIIRDYILENTKHPVSYIS